MANLSNWYETKCTREQALIDLICNRTCFVTNDKDFDRFLATLSNYDISTADQFAVSFFAEYEGVEASSLNQFIQDWIALAKGCIPQKLLKQRKPEQLWLDVIQFDFHKINFNGNTYFFRKVF